MADVEKLRNRVVEQRERPARRPQAARPHAGGAGGGVHQVQRAGRGPRPPAAAAAQRSARSTERRLTELQKDEAGSTTCSPPSSAPGGTRRARGLRGAAPVPGSITTADLGKLDWPVEGAIVYRFGRDTLPSGGIIRWNGIGIAADDGHAGEGGGGGEGAAGGTVRHLRAHRGAGARQRVLLGLLPPPVRGGEARQRPSRGARRSAPWAARTPTTDRTCTSRSGARTRSRSIRRTGFGSAEAGLSPRPRPARPICALPRGQRGLDQREQVVRLADRGMGVGHDPGAERRLGHGAVPALDQLLADPRDRAARAVGAGLGQNDGELAAAVAGDEVRQPEPALERAPTVSARPRSLRRRRTDLRAAPG